MNEFSLNFEPVAVASLVMRISVSVISLVVLFAGCSRGSDEQSREYYSSISTLTELVFGENLFIDFLEEAIRQKYYLKYIIDDFIKEVARVSLNIEQNPVDTFKLVYRSYHDFAQLEEQMMRTDYIEVYKKNVSELGILVEERELIGASMALARLQNVYQLPTEDVASGILLDYDTSLEMRGIDCFEIGRHLHNAAQHIAALEWLSQARLRLLNDHEDMNELSVVSYQASSYFHLGNYKMALKLCREMLEIDPTNKYALDTMASAKGKLETLRQLPLTKELPPTPEVKKSTIEDMYEKVCRGELTQTPREKRDLRCRYTSNNVPFCILAPFKMEEMSLDPYVRVFYDVIFDNEISFIRNETDERLARSRVTGFKDSIVSEVRTSQNTWLKLRELQPLANVVARLDDITGLDLEAGEEMQVANYGIGGHYGAHYDFMEGDRANYKGYLGNRIMTALFYISEVELGGGTGFPFLRLLVPPVKGSLVVWYNLHESLEPDYRSRHAGCPVLRGDKHICNEWYHSTYQEFRRPCLLYSNGNESIAYKNVQ